MTDGIDGGKGWQDQAIAAMAEAHGVSTQDITLALSLAFPGKRVDQAPLLDRICTAYEDGYAHGLEGDAEPNPYHLDAPEAAAWVIGRRGGFAAFCSVVSGEQ